MKSQKRARSALLGNHPAMKRVQEQICRYGPTQSPVLVLGETGTGKELVARALHATSARHHGPLEVLNCAAIPGGLAESELFGHTRGAFTGSTRDYVGAFERAHGGSLFLDEIGEMPLTLQPKLLRVLEDGCLRRVGDERKRQVDVRLIAATHRQLQRDTERQGFRLDLFHRLAVGVIQLPPLRKRRSDIPLLAHHFLAAISAQAGHTMTLSNDACDFLREQAWPGNVRALRNAVERAATSRASVLQSHHFDDPSDGSALLACEEFVRYADRPFTDTQREIYERTIDKHAGNRTAAAAELQIPKSTFFDHLRLLKISR